MCLIREMTIDDLDAVMINEVRAYAFPWTRGIFLDCLKARYECWVLVCEDEIIGHSVLSVAARESHLLNVCVGRDYQGQGHGRTLLSHMVERARHCDATMLFLEVRTSNQVAAHLYETAGFNEVGRRKNYYPTQYGHEDARVYAMELF